MRALLIGVGGGTVGVVLFGLSQIGGGLLGAGAFVIALFMVPLTAGAVIAALFVAWQEWRAPRFGIDQLGPPSRTRQRCGSCPPQNDPARPDLDLSPLRSRRRPPLKRQG